MGLSELSAAAMCCGLSSLEMGQSRQRGVGLEAQQRLRRGMTRGTGASGRHSGEHDAAAFQALLAKCVICGGAMGGVRGSWR